MIRITKKKNPTNKEVLKGIKIQKIPDGHHIRYKLFHNDNYIGDVWYDIHRGFVTSVEIDWELQRNGIITYVYDYIEKDQKIKLKPSTQLTDAGKAFWKNRLKKKNPTDLQLLKLITIKKKIIADNLYGDDLISYKIYFRNKQIGYAEIFINNNYIEDIEIDEEFRRKGIANFIYSHIENDLKKSLVPSSVQLEDGKKFWKNRLRK